MDATIRIAIDGRGAKTGAKDVNNALDSMRIGMNKAKDSMSGFSTAFSAFRGIMGGIGIAFGGKEAIMAADQYNTLQNRIKSATKATHDYAGVSRALFGISQENAVALKSTVGTFQAVARGAGELGKSNAEIITFVSTLQKLGSIGGSSAQEMEDGLRQLSQGLAGGIIRAEEWNSIVENVPEIAVRAAKGIEAAGGSIGKLRKIMLDGKLTSLDFFNAIQKQAPEIQKEFANIPLSVEQAMTKMKNASDKAFSDLDKQLGGGTSALAQGMSFLADNMGKVATAALLLGTVITGALVGRGLNALMGAMGLVNAGQAAMVSNMETGARAMAANAAASQAQAASAVATARAQQAAAVTAVQVATANRNGALAGLQMAKAQDAVTGGMAKTAAAAKVLQAAQAQLVLAERGVATANATVTATSAVATAAIGRMTIASRVGAVAMRGLSGAMALFGGPLGAGITAAAAGYAYLSTRVQESDKENSKLEEGLNRIQDINMKLVTATGAQKDALIAEKKAVIDNAQAYADAARIKADAEENVSGVRKVLKSPVVGVRRLLGWDAQSGEGDVSTMRARQEDIQKRLDAMKAAANEEIPQLATPTTPENDDDKRKREAFEKQNRQNIEKIKTLHAVNMAYEDGRVGVEKYQYAIEDLTTKQQAEEQVGKGRAQAILEQAQAIREMEKANEFQGEMLANREELQQIKDLTAAYGGGAEAVEMAEAKQEAFNHAVQRGNASNEEAMNIYTNAALARKEANRYLESEKHLADMDKEIDAAARLATAWREGGPAVRDAALEADVYAKAVADGVQNDEAQVQKIRDKMLALRDLKEVQASDERQFEGSMTLEQGYKEIEISKLTGEQREIEKAKLDMLMQKKRELKDVTAQLTPEEEKLAISLGKLAAAGQTASNSLDDLARRYGDTNTMMADLATGSLLTLEDGLVDIATGAKSAKEAFADMARDIAKQLMRTAIQMAIIRPLAMGMGMMFAGGGVMTPSGPMDLPMYAKGGIMSKLGDIPLKTYSTGGVANSPQVAVFGEGRQNEAYVPLPDGRRIPVALEGGGAGGGNAVSITNHINVNMPQGATKEQGQQFGDAIARQVEDAMNANLMKQQRPGGLLDPYGYGTG